ncbi:MAG: hypothetical protein ACPHDT_09115, partial [Acidimicrobiales bacterium]
VVESSAEVPETADPSTTGSPSNDTPAGGFGSIELTAVALADASGADLGMVAELERMGLIEGNRTDDGTLFDHVA